MVRKYSLTTKQVFINANTYFPTAALLSIMHCTHSRNVWRCVYQVISTSIQVLKSYRSNMKHNYFDLRFSSWCDLEGNEPWAQHTNSDGKHLCYFKILPRVEEGTQNMLHDLYTQEVTLKTAVYVKPCILHITLMGWTLCQFGSYFEVD